MVSWLQISGVTTTEWIVLSTATVAAIAAAVSAGIAAWQAVLMKGSERNRTQPIVVVSERGDPAVLGQKRLIFQASNRNAGVGPALNIQFGIRIADHDYPYVSLPSGGGRIGDVPRALEAGGTGPAGDGTYQLVVGIGHTLAQDDMDSRTYWCRYENAFGDAWQTTNPWQADQPLDIESLSH
jgi:hypothetical protein